MNTPVPMNLLVAGSSSWALAASTNGLAFGARRLWPEDPAFVEPAAEAAMASRSGLAGPTDHPSIGVSNQRLQMPFLGARGADTLV